MAGSAFFSSWQLRHSACVRRSRQLYAGDIFGDADFVATQATCRDRRVHCLTFSFFCVALQALRGIDILIQRNRMGLCSMPEALPWPQEKGLRRMGEEFAALANPFAPCAL